MSFLVSVRRLVSTVLVVMTFAVLALGTSARADGDRRIVVVTSRDDGPYAKVVSGIRGSLTARAGDTSVIVYSLQGDAANAGEALRKAEARAPLVTVGSVATRAALEAESDAPVIACMTVDAAELRQAENATGVVLEFPLETQLQWVRRFLTKGQSVGVLYNPAENREEIRDAKRIARGLGLRIVDREIRQPQDLPGALASLAREADLLWGLTDQLVLSQQTAEAILLFSFRNRIPFAGLSESWVKAGALYALDRDYEDLGAQCGEMALEVLGGQSVSSVPLATPRKVTYSINLRTAEHLKLDLPPELIEGADQVFR